MPRAKNIAPFTDDNDIDAVDENAVEFDEETNGYVIRDGAEAPAEAAPDGQAKRGRGLKNELFYAEPNEDEAVKLTPQAKIIHEIVLNNQGISRADLVSQLATQLTTKQPPERVLGYYKRQLTNSRLIRTETPAKPEEPAAEAS